MTTRVRIAAFAALLALAGGGAALVGAATGADAPAGGEHAADPPATPREPAATDAPGLAAAAGGLRLVPEPARPRAGVSTPFRFRVVDARGRAVRGFDVEHERRMHVIVVRRDLTGYQHLHPRQLRDGAWETDLRLARPGTHRLFADFSRGGRAQTLGIDLNVAGEFAPRALPAPSDRAAAGDGYEVAVTGAGDRLRFSVSRHDRPVTDVEPYLGARGHLVALREGDLAYLHVHPEDAATAGRDVRFRVEYPSAGRYRLFLQFKHDGRVRTVAFTRAVGAASTAGHEEEAGDGHGD